MNIFGVDLKHQHFPYLLERPQTKVDWFEVISENFMNTRGYPLETLMKIREDYPISLHGVGMSIGQHHDLDHNYLKKLKELINLIDPILVSDHLCWTGAPDRKAHNLLPLPYNQETLNKVVSRIQKIQDYLGREVSFENVSAYFELKSSTYSEWEFLREVSKKSGSKILLDINNIYVNSKNHKFDPYEYLDAINEDLISEIHLAGHTDTGSFLFDTHSTSVCSDVWELYQYKIKNKKNIYTLIEWDEDVPEFKELEAEAIKARLKWEESDGQAL